MDTKSIFPDHFEGKIACHNKPSSPPLLASFTIRAPPVTRRVHGCPCRVGEKKKERGERVARAGKQRARTSPKTKSSTSSHVPPTCRFRVLACPGARVPHRHRRRPRAHSLRCFKQNSGDRSAAPPYRAREKPSPRFLLVLRHDRPPAPLAPRAAPLRRGGSGPLEIPKPVFLPWRVVRVSVTRRRAAPPFPRKGKRVVWLLLVSPFSPCVLHPCFCGTGPEAHAHARTLFVTYTTFAPPHRPSVRAVPAPWSRRVAAVA